MNDAEEHKLLLVLKANKFYSLLSIGDIQRALIHNIKVDRYISEILRLMQN